MKHAARAFALVFSLLLLLAIGVLSVSAEDTLYLPSSLKVIEDRAFYGNTSLDEVVLPDGVMEIRSMAFANSSLTEIMLPDSLTIIADDAFTGCGDIVITASESSYAYGWAVRNGFIHKQTAPATDFEYRRASNGISITKYTGSGGYVVVPEQIEGVDVISIEYKAFSETDITGVILPETVRSVKQQAFHSCASLKSVIIPSRLDSLGSWVFAGCPELITVRIPDGITQIESCLFYNCQKLEQVNIPIGITTVGSWAFAGCSSLKSIILPDTVTLIEERAFAWCNQMTDCHLSAGLLSVGYEAFNGCSSLTHIELPQGLTSIGESVFTYCSKLQSIAVPDGIKAIPAHTFDHCIGLTNIALPDGLESIGECAFDYCTGILSISIPETVNSIGPSAFSNVCTSICFSGAMPSISDDAFSGSSIIVSISGDSAGWSVESDYGASWIVWSINGGAQTITDDTKDPSETLTVTITDNQDLNDYENWSSTVKSNLVINDDGSYTRVEYTGNDVLIEEYSSEHNLTWKKTLSPELPIWGGFFSGNEYNFLVFGQNNEEENDNKEVIRIVKYTKSWNRIAHCSVYGANTIQPFAFGSVRFSQSNDILYLYTCHVMYTTPDGANHQANMSFEVYIPTMKFTHQNYEIGGVTYEYVSHSLNQLLLIDGSDIIKVDHGDAYPRSVRLMKIKGSAGYVAIGDRSEATMLAIAGNIGENYTGVSVGALQASGTCYIVAGNSINQNNAAASNQRNIFVSTVNKNAVSDSNVRLSWITNYAEGSSIAVTTPQMVRINDNRFLLIWSEGSNVKYVFLNGNGDKLTDIYSASADLSDCQPVVGNDCVMWYVTRNSAIVMYSISLTAPYALTAG